MHYITRVGLEYVKEQVLGDAERRRALYERLQFAMMEVPDPWAEPEQAHIDQRQFAPVASP